MKKLLNVFISVMLVLVLALTLSSCFNADDGKVSEKDSEKQDGPTDTPRDTEIEDAPTDGATSALSILEKAWSSMPEDKRFAAIGGNADSPVDNAPGNFGIDDAGMIDNSLGFPASSASMIDEAASLIHMMNANTFTAAGYRVADKANLSAAVKAIDDNLSTRQWICGFPEKLIIATVDDRYIISMFGAGELVDPMLEQIKASYPSATAVVNKTME